MKKLGLFLVLALLLGLWAWHALDRLGAARAAQAEAMAATRAPSVTAAARLPAASAVDAQNALARLLGDAASTATVRLALSPLPVALDGLVQARIEAHGSEDRLRAFLLAAEAPPSPIRFPYWTIAADGAGALRLVAQAAAPWQLPAAADSIRLADAPAAPSSPARTLFAIDAAPDARPAADAPPELIGIAGRLPNDAVALVRLPDGTTQSLRPGGSIHGWTLLAIAADRARFGRGATQREVVLPPRD